MQFHRRRIAKTRFRAVVNPTDPEGPKSPDRTAVQNCMVFNLNLSQNRAVLAAGKPGTVLGRFWDLPDRDLRRTRSEGRPDRQDDQDDPTIKTMKMKKMMKIVKMIIITMMITMTIMMMK